MNEAARVCKHYFQGEFLFSSIAPEQVVGAHPFFALVGVGYFGSPGMRRGRGPGVPP